jgi:alpha-N-arabinofuranosidase
MYAVHQDAQLIPVNFETPLFEKMGESLPALSISASKDQNNQINISLVNIDDTETHEVSIDVAQLGVNEFEGSILVSKALQDYNDFDNPEVITPKPMKNIKVKKGIATVELPPFSVVVLEGK